MSVPDTWHDPDSIRTLWADAPRNDEALETLLAVARVQVEAYGGELAEDAPVPVTYRLAQQMQTRDLWNANKVDSGTGQLDDGSSFTIRPFPMSWAIKAVIRPETGIPVVG